MKVLLLFHVACTLYMLGVIAVVQWVHYPLFSHVDPSSFGAYHENHMRRISSVVMFPMLAELFTAALLVWLRPEQIPIWMTLIGLVLLLLIWISTFMQQVPAHRELARGFNSRTHQRLGRTNWIRTGAWASRSILVLAMVYDILP